MGQRRQIQPRDLDGRICPLHKIPANGCGYMHSDGQADPTSSWCFQDDCPAAICGGPHFEVLVHMSADRRETPVKITMRADQFKDHKVVYCPSCTSPVITNKARCGHPFHLFDESHNYNSIVSREGDGADAGGRPDPLVQEPKE